MDDMEKLEPTTKKNAKAGLCLHCGGCFKNELIAGHVHDTGHCCFLRENDVTCEICGFKFSTTAPNQAVTDKVGKLGLLVMKQMQACMAKLMSH